MHLNGGVGVFLRHVSNPRTVRHREAGRLAESAGEPAEVGRRSDPEGGGRVQPT